jgi:uncharacterized protein
MSGSLRDQLLKTGLVSKDQAKKAENQAKSKAHQQQKQKRKKKKRGQTAEPIDKESATYLAEKAREEQVARAKELNRQREAERQQKELQAQVRNMIQTHYIKDHKADIIYHFVEGQFVRQIDVNATQQMQLDHGQLAITVLDESYYLVPASIAEKILERSPKNILLYHKKEEKENNALDDPYYADFPIPDDLMW